MAARPRSNSKKTAASRSTTVFFVTGSDEAEVKKKAVELAAGLSPSDDPFATEVIDGTAGNVEEAKTALQLAAQSVLTLPFFGSKLVWLKNVSFFADTVTGRSEAVAEAAAHFLETVEAGLPDGIRLLISAPEADKRRSTYKTLSKIATLHVCDKPDFGWNSTEEDVVQWVAKRVREHGLNLTPEAIEVLTARVGTESRQLDQELEKLALAFDAGHLVSDKDIRSLVPATRSGGIFDLSNALAKRDLDLSAASLDQLLRQGERGIAILLAAIVPTIRNLLAVKDLLESHGLAPPSEARYFAGTLNKIPESAKSHLPRKKDGSVNAYALGIAAANSRRFSLRELRDAFTACVEANRALVTTSLSESVVLTKLIVRIAARTDPS